jgi:hypothetical protein
VAPIISPENMSDREEKLALLRSMDPALFTTGRASKENRSYHLTNEIQPFARQLGVQISGRNKKQVVEDILKMGYEMGAWKK